VPAQIKHSDSYWVAKDRVRRSRGRADEHRCADCAAPARVWSYDGADPGERVDPARGYLYSLDPAHYRPRCQSCHRRATTILHSNRPLSPRPRYRPARPDCPAATDAEPACGASGMAASVAADDGAQARAVWLYERGVSLRGVGEELGISASTAGRLLRGLGVTIRPVGRRSRGIGSAS
jgi:transposase-like protein